MKKKNEGIPEVVIPRGYGLDEIMDTSDEFGDETPILTEEVKVRFE